MVPPPLRKENPFIIFSPSGCLALFSTFREVRGIKWNDPSKNSSDDEDSSYSWRPWLYYFLPSSGFTPALCTRGQSSGRLALRSSLARVKDPSSPCQKGMMLWTQCAILPVARKSHIDSLSDRDNIGKWSVAHLSCHMQGGRGCLWCSGCLWPSQSPSALLSLQGAETRGAAWLSSLLSKGSRVGADLPLWGAV